MKKVTLSIAGVLSSLLVFAQEKTDLAAKTAESTDQTHYTNMIPPIIIVGLLIFLIISVIRYVLEYRLKNKIVNRGISEQLSTSLLEKNSKNKNDEAMKLAILLCGIGAGLTITYYTLPLNIHSLAIMAFSIGASYFAYFFYLKSQKR